MHPSSSVVAGGSSLTALPRCIRCRPQAQWQAGSFQGVFGGRPMPWAVDRGPSANARCDMLNGASNPQYGDASRRQPYDVQRLQRKRYGNHSQRPPKLTWKRRQKAAARRAKRRTRYEHCASSQHRRLTSAQSPPSPTTSSPSPLSFEKSLRYLLYRPQRHPRWPGRRSSSIAS